MLFTILNLLFNIIKFIIQVKKQQNNNRDRNVVVIIVKL